MRRRLDQLRQEIISELCVRRWHDVWFFPPREGINGWRGTDPVMFIGPNPSRGHFPSHADLFFYGQLKQNGFSNAHLTDLFKICATSEEMRRHLADRALVRLHQTYLSKEIEILDPRLLVALSDETLKTLQCWLPKSLHTRLIKIRHYSWANRYNRREEFSKDMAEVNLRLRTHGAANVRA